MHRQTFTVTECIYSVVLKFVRGVMVAARNFQGNKTMNKKLKDLRQMIYLSIFIPIEYCLEYDDWFLFLQNDKFISTTFFSYNLNMTYCMIGAK